MASTVFTDKQTVIPAAWLNDTNQLVYQGRTPNFAVTTGSANAQVLTLETGSIYTTGSELDGDTFSFKAGFTNTGATTLKIIPPNGTNTAVAAQMYGSALVGGEIVSGRLYLATRSGSTWQISAVGGGTRPATRQILNSTQTYTAPTGLVWAFVQVQAAGGGGGGTDANASSVAGSGGAGGYAEAVLTAKQIGASQAVTIGARGTPGANTGTDGGNGGTASFGSLCSASGGNGGKAGTGGSIGAAGAVSGSIFSDFVTSSQAAAPSTTTTSGMGGSCLWGAGSPGVSGTDGTTNNSYGAGASGGAGASKAGGTGGLGLCIVTEHYA